MKVLLLGVALLCMSHVRGDGDLLHSLFDEKVKELKDQNAEPSVFLAADTAAAPAAPAAPAALAVVAPDCDVQHVVANGNQLVKNTLDIMADTFKIVYTAMYPNTGTKDCSLGTFRCFLKEFNDVKDSIQSVKTNVMTYKEKAAGLSKDITDYFQYCANKAN